MPEIIFKYFPDLTEQQKSLIIDLKGIYSNWNTKINLISRKDFDLFYERHVLHSLSISKFIQFEDESHILDFGTGGGFPGIPLSILFPNCNFLLVDSVQKKINVVNNVIDELNLNNAQTKWTRVEQIDGKFDYITGRAVKDIGQILKWTKPLLNGKSIKKKSGIYYLKGGDFFQELKQAGMKSKVFNLNEVIEGEFFETKKLIRFYL